MTKHERAIRKALKAFEPMLPGPTMIAMRKLIEQHLAKVKRNGGKIARL